MTVTTTDNNCGNFILPATISEEELNFFRSLSDCSLSELAAANDLITIPHSYATELQTDSRIFSLSARNAIFTGNIVGFIGDGKDAMNITSRFDKSGQNWLIHYLLCKVFCINITSLPNFASPSSILDILPLLFPVYLHRALAQGIYRPYADKKNNDLRLRGRIDVGRYIINNMPFAGKVASVSRERSADNPLIHLIRHTIEHISQSTMMKGLLSSNNGIIEDIKIIKSITPSFDKRNLGKVILANQKLSYHPYFTEYGPLQRLCLMILNRNKIAYEKKGNKIHGLLIDMAWLWEEYLAKVLTLINVTHPRNRSKMGRVYISNLKIAPTIHKDNFQERYPDIYTDQSVIDAKYKRDVSRDDYHQIITYMHILGKHNSILLSPNGGESDNINSYRLNGQGGNLHLYKMSIPQTVDSYNSYIEAMHRSEDFLVDWLINLEQNRGIYDQA